MWFASIWVFTLELPWELGADFFLRHLLDGDPASNTLSWRWVAGIQTPGKTYLARPDNIARNTEGRFRPAAEELAASAPPVSAGAPPEPGPPPEPVAWEWDRPTALLLTEEDLTPEPLIPADALAAVIPFQATWHRSPWPVGAGAVGFVDGALADAEARLRDCGAPVPGERVATVAAITDQARAAGVGRVLTPYVPVGPTRDALAPLEGALAEHGIQLTPVLRHWDRLAWPHATAGFFATWKRIRPQLAAMGVAALGPGAG